MANTITAFYEFTSTSLAFASQMTANFNLFRGDQFPIDVTAGASTNLTHNLGATDARWTNVHGNRWNAPTAGAYLVLDDITCSAWQRQSSSDGTDPGHGGTVYNKTTGSYTINFTSITAISGSTLTLSTLAKPVEINFMATWNCTSSASENGFEIYLFIDNSVTTWRGYKTRYSGSFGNNRMIFPNCYQWFHMQPGQTTRTYHFGAKVWTTSAQLSIEAPFWMAKEIR